jgi:tetratricopeptide (TPR) repeat protein
MNQQLKVWNVGRGSQRKLARALCALSLFVAASFCFAAGRIEPDLKSLYNTHHWFALRDAVQPGKSPIFYRGAVEAIFNQLKSAEQDLRRAISVSPNTLDAYEAQSLLAGMYLRTGEYREARAQVELMIGTRPDAKEARDVISLFQVLSRTPDQSVVQKQRSTLQMRIEDGNIFLPITLDGRAATYAFDTDAAVSLLSESEAKRLGLAVLDVDTKIEGMSGIGVAARVAVADNLFLGNVHLAHVAFYVLPDKQPPFNDLPVGSRGVLGIPVILALQTLRWNPKAGIFECAFPAKPEDIRHANIAFDDASPVTQVFIQRRPLEFSLDTGAQQTDLYPAFAKEFANFVGDYGKKESHKLTGIDGSATFESTVLPAVTIQVGGREVVLNPARVYLEEHNSTSQWYFGNLGMDLFNQARSVTLDFQAMTLTLE